MVAPRRPRRPDRTERVRQDGCGTPGFGHGLWTPIARRVAVDGCAVRKGPVVVDGMLLSLSYRDGETALMVSGPFASGRVDGGAAEVRLRGHGGPLTGHTDRVLWGAWGEVDGAPVLATTG